LTKRIIFSEGEVYFSPRLCPGIKETSKNIFPEGEL
jgi:hypothetical protein